LPSVRDGIAQRQKLRYLPSGRLCAGVPAAAIIDHNEKHRSPARRARALARRGILQDTVSRPQRLDRDQHFVHFALRVTGRPRAASTEEPRNLPHRLARTLVGDAVHHDDGDAIGRAHRPITSKPARASALVSYFALSALRQVMLNLTL
jgi:hypothetical protein